MYLIIDGYNLMHCMKLKGENFQKKRENFINELHLFVKANSVNIILVFDGSKNISQYKSIEKQENVKIIYSAHNQTADDVIVELIKTRKTKSKNMVLITSDRELVNYAEENRIKTMSSSDFAQYFE